MGYQCSELAAKTVLPDSPGDQVDRQECRNQIDPNLWTNMIDEPGKSREEDRDSGHARKDRGTSIRLSAHPNVSNVCSEDLQVETKKSGD